LGELGIRVRDERLGMRDEELILLKIRLFTVLGLPHNRDGIIPELVFQMSQI